MTAISPYAAAALRRLDEALAPHLRLYALLDGARDERLVTELRASGRQQHCLLSGRTPREVQVVAPWLVELTGASSDPFATWVVERGWGSSWAVFLLAAEATPGTTIAAHFSAELAWAQLEDGPRVLFRYYDPRVLRAFAPMGDEAQLAVLFRHAAAFLLEDERPDALLRLERGPELRATRAALAATPAAQLAPVGVRLSPDEVIERIAALRPDPADPSPLRAVAELGLLHQSLLGWEVEGEAALVQRIKTELARVVRRLEGRRYLTAPAVSASIASLMVAVGRPTRPAASGG